MSRQLFHKVPVNYWVAGTPSWLQKIQCPPEKKLPIVKEQDLQPWLEWLGKQPMLAVDCETGGASKKDALDPLSPDSWMLLWQIGTRERQLIGEPDVLLPYLRPVLQDARIRKIGVRLVFDYEQALARYAIRLVNVACCMLTEQVIQAGLQGVSAAMGAMSRRYPPHYILDKGVRNDFIVQRRDDPISQEELEYSAGDIVCPFLIYDAQQEVLASRKLEFVLEAIEFPCLHATAEMELEGVLMDSCKFDLVIRYYERELQNKSREIQRAYQKISGKTGSVLFHDLEGYEWLQLSSPSKKLAGLRAIGIDLVNTERTTMEALANDPKLDHQRRYLAQLLVEYSGLAKMVSSYGKNFKDRIKPNGRIHAEYNQLGGDFDHGPEERETISTGRYSGDFQQIPRPRDVYAEATPEELQQLMSEFSGLAQELAAAA